MIYDERSSAGTCAETSPENSLSANQMVDCWKPVELPVSKHYNCENERCIKVSIAARRVVELDGVKGDLVFFLFLIPILSHSLPSSKVIDPATEALLATLLGIFATVGLIIAGAIVTCLGGCCICCVGAWALEPFGK